MRVPLNETAVIKLSGTGAGTAKLGPQSAREVWYPSVASVSVVTNVLEATCNVSVGDANTRTFCDGCVDGSSGDSTGNVSGKTIKVSQFVWAEWTGGDANAQARLTVTGEREV